MLKFTGTIKESYGLKGEMLLLNVPDGLKIIKSGTKVQVGFSEKFGRTFTIEEFKIKNKKYLFKLKELNSPEQIIEFKEQGIFIDDSSLEFSNELFLVDELIGCSVFDTKTNKEIGILKDVLVLPANDVWLIDMQDGELPIPVIKDVVKKVNIEKKRIDISIIDGLLELKSSNEKRKETYRADEN